MEFSGYTFERFDTLESTNEYAKKIAAEGAKEKTVVLASYQTKGKGRAGRSFYSPNGSNIYMSVILRPAVNFTDAQLITVLAASCTALAIETVTNKSVGIKWVNDIYLDNKKVAGILAEVAGGVDKEGIVDSIILGIGINVFEADEVPKDISDIYGAVYSGSEMIEDSEIRNRISDNIVKKFIELFDACYGGIKCNTRTYETTRMIEEYKNHSIVIGREVTYMSANEEKKVRVVGIDDDGSLIVFDESGERKKYRDGEIRIKLF